MRFFFLSFMLCSASAATCAGQTVSAPRSKIAVLDTRRLPNAVQVHPRVISGGLPDGRAGLEELKAMGVRHIVCVDGAKPDVKTARELGLRYIHLPHGYDGVPQRRVLELAKAIRDAEGPVYVHCHHGRHRSPAAAAAACVAAGMIDGPQAAKVLKVAGTSPRYVGLFRSVSDARPVPRTTLDSLAAEFPEVARVPPLADAMVELEHAMERIERLSAARWKTRAGARNEPGGAAHETLLLRELYTELLRADHARRHGRQFMDSLRNGEAQAVALEKLAAKMTDSETSRRALDDAVKRLRSHCRDCHRRHRDRPSRDQRDR